MRFIVTPRKGCHHFSTTRAAQKGVFTPFQAENLLGIGRRKIPLRKSLDLYKVNLDAMIWKMPADYVTKPLTKFDIKGAWVSIIDVKCPYVAPRTRTCQLSRVMDAAQKMEEPGDQLMVSKKACGKGKLKIREQLTHPKNTDHTMTQPRSS